MRKFKKLALFSRFKLGSSMLFLVMYNRFNYKKSCQYIHLTKNVVTSRQQLYYPVIPGKQLVLKHIGLGFRSFWISVYLVLTGMIAHTRC